MQKRYCSKLNFLFKLISGQNKEFNILVSSLLCYRIRRMWNTESQELYFFFYLKTKQAKLMAVKGSNSYKVVSIFLFFIKMVDVNNYTRLGNLI